MTRHLISVAVKKHRRRSELPVVALFFFFGLRPLAPVRKGFRSFLCASGDSVRGRESRTKLLRIGSEGKRRKGFIPRLVLSRSVDREQPTQNWHGQRESDCLIKTKHCAGPPFKNGVSTQCDFCPVL